ncbi:MAG TPA: hypothetical protein VKG44_05760 [Candidatus Baltobacteraceae bacterium]|nr:hypothetical protein [Candidatus Baltobacteraceae bacterium]
MKFSCALILALAFAPSLAFGADPAATPAPDGHPTATEQPFISKISSDLQARFATTDAAVKAGYIRFTDEDSTGAISYANRQWTSADPAHPSQLWYDVNGRLIGADFSVLQANSPNAPSLWGVQASRWQKIPAHVHFGVAGPNGTTVYGGAGPKSMAAINGDMAAPTPATVVALGKAKSADDVRFVFAFPAIWDLIVWVVPNPSGAFAEKNPNVIPSKNAKMQM